MHGLLKRLLVLQLSIIVELYHSFSMLFASSKSLSPGNRLQYAVPASLMPHEQVPVTDPSLEAQSPFDVQAFGSLLDVIFPTHFPSAQKPEEHSGFS